MKIHSQIMGEVEADDLVHTIEAIAGCQYLRAVVMSSL